MRFALTLSLILVTLDATLGQSSQDAQPPSEAEQLYATAMRFELDGENRYREMTLRAAINSDPDFAPAHWQLGEVNEIGVWKSVSSSKLTDDDLIRAYGTRRDQALGDSEAEFALAKWCAQNKLMDRARFHYARVAFDPSASDAHRKMAIRRAQLKEYYGQLVNSQQYDVLMDRERKVQDAIKKWDPKMTKWRETLLGSSDRKREKALEELAKVQTAEAIPSMERILTPAAEHVALRVVDVLDNIPHHEATMSLVRHAVSAPWPSLVQASSVALKKRPMHEYVPALLSGLDTPVYYKSGRTKRVDLDAPLSPTGFQLNGFVRETVVFKEGLDQNVLVRNRNLIGPPGHTLVIRNAGRGPAYFAPVGNPFSTTSDDPETREAQILSSQIRAELNEQRFRNKVAANNAQIEKLNARLFSLLAYTTGQTLPQRTTEWWDWWHDYNEVSSGGYGVDKPTFVTNSYTSTIPVIIRASCFVAGTPVWTDLGRRPIESLSIGDRVLSQHPDTGELSFQIVTGHTIRPPSDMINFQLGDEVISATKGHPFWLNGTGWRMAKLLQPNQRLHALHGSAAITAVSTSERQEAHNLVVAGTGTYFVGQAGVLVHDNTYRQPSRAVIPGYVDKVATKSLAVE